ncbi:Cysteine-rich motor neuron 1 protein [Habropoda laboriosa]|uniref:Cysteine-rich motor neuron 1 protein n=1 Tax=Habropoda laboriosa TaxID=597456 RepID=A0A0L7RB74_9HYME|nr:PREDICTED: cysteine-rich motor neuron 1 protein [Habropoda laboriosa]XP_017799399.1 PREDICTED: cysteine-rich motor neuron 1 protein [Habropoda laboriosa]KOC68070.1 Cysteine-rich motor neuron 1 protein [Habropoda laboriosa]
MRAPLLLLGGVVVFSVAVARAFSCVCSPFECDILTDDDCPGGLTWDPCRCCKLCARVEEEPCGGLFGFSGSCGDGLQCVIKNLLPNTRELDEGVCTKIPGRWRKHCPHGQVMSEPGCNLVSGVTVENGKTVSTGKCVCGRSVPWCPNDPRPYDYSTEHECKLNLAVKMGYDGLFNPGNTASDDVEGEGQADECPDDSVRGENGDCKCAADCPSVECPAGQRPLQVKSADPELPGSCCARYVCVLSDSRGFEPCPENTVLTEDGKCECAPCPPASCQPEYRPVQVKAAREREPSASCCPLYECRPTESVTLVKVDPEITKAANYCIYEDKARKLGERWQQSDCVNCVCQEDGVSCQEPMCKSCENAIPPDPGECCPHCPPPTPEPPCRSRSRTPEGCTLTCEHGYATDENNCPTCSCAETMRNETTEDRTNNDLDELVDDVCPDLADCQLNCELVKDEGGCSVCACHREPPPRAFDHQPRNDTVPVDEKKICPEVTCDLHCEQGLLMDENDCTFCKCREPDTSCPSLVGCKKRCAFGYKKNKRGCSICRCRASCTDHFNGTHPEGSTWHPNTCSSCTCEAGGKLSCKETVCSVACNDPLPPNPGTCCPICPITTTKGNETSGGGHQGGKSWGTVPITLIVILALLCLLLIVHIVRGRFRARLSPSEASYTSYPPQYYKCVPVYDTPVHRNEKIVPL